MSETAIIAWRAVDERGCIELFLDEANAREFAGANGYVDALALASITGQQSNTYRASHPCRAQPVAGCSMSEKGEARSREAIAETLCSMHFTDGFCMPRHDPECRCNKLAAACLITIETRGVELVWTPPPLNMETNTQ